ncbi:alkaline phosphatase D family protein [Agaribacterium haliotis]|uniref:alkaline phosphatase D family protein n=1 Tax=Agaribacterium haliotis TaxID=2013869 RepID=UPI000BB5872B|nr:alkaline phosphatase D family protein [Agaribacterium haliotis]
MSSIQRRDLIKFSAMGLGSVVVSSGLVACGGDDDGAGPTEPGASIAMSFSHGVASGDPQADRVILWTRALPEDVDSHSSLTVVYELASDPDFNKVLRRGEAEALAENDYTIKVDAIELSPATEYYYRFLSNGKKSAVGRTKTLPAEGADVSQVKLAMFSCSNYPRGFFNAYSEAAKMTDLDAALHLGDYIYEYRMGEYATEKAEMIGRELPADNDVELIELDDYRKRYALYRSDLGLAALHAVVPMIVVPDDHEVANDAHIGGAENHTEASEGDFTRRKYNALKAYFEWLPIRPASEGDLDTLYRRFQWGELVNLMMLDTRLIARTEALSLSDARFYNSDGSFNAAAFVAAVSDEQRALLGSGQLQWLQQQLSASNATWQLLGQQVLMGKMNIPLEVLVQLGAAADPAASLAELAQIKQRQLQGDTSLSEQELARVNSVAPYNLDAWDGYQYEREVLYASAKQLGKNLVVLAGDTHNAWANNLVDRHGDAVGVEFAVAAVSSPGMEQYLDLDEPGAASLAQGLSLLIDDLQWANLHDRGLAVLSFSKEQAQCEWLFVDTIEEANYQLKEASTKRLSVKLGENKLSMHS